MEICFNGKKFVSFEKEHSMKTILLLIGSNLFMTFAWYGHLKTLQNKPLIVAIIISWGIAFFEYVLQVPANRIGYQIFTLAQLKIIQENHYNDGICRFRLLVPG